MNQKQLMSWRNIKRSNEVIAEDNTKNQQQITDMTARFKVMHKQSRQQITVDWQTRVNRLERLEKMVVDNQDEISIAISQDFGYRSPSETTMLEVFPTLEGIRYSKKHGKEWMKPKKVATGKWFLPATSYVQKQPLGVVGIISPWNYPLYLAAGPLTAAFVAGNRAMLKTSEFTPNFNQWLAKTLPNYFSADELCFINGGVEIAQAFSALPFDHLLFTGSTAVGRHIMRAAASNLTPVTLELGGKSPVVITDSASLEKAVNRIWTGKLMNAGQTCISPDYLLLPTGLEQKFLQLSYQWVSKHYPNIAKNPDFSYLVNQRQFDRVLGYLEQAEQTGADINILGEVEPDAKTGFMPPMVVTNLVDDTKLLTEEIFAPVLPVVAYKSIEDAIDYINKRPRPLALYVFGEDDKINDKVVANTVSGGVSINDTIFHIAQHGLPFGGVGDSGMGNYHGQYGFDTFTHEKGVFKQAKINFVDMLQPPYGKVFDKLMQVAKKL